MKYLNLAAVALTLTVASVTAMPTAAFAGGGDILVTGYCPPPSEADAIANLRAQVELYDKLKARAEANGDEFTNLPRPTSKTFCCVDPSRIPDSNPEWKKKNCIKVVVEQITVVDSYVIQSIGIKSTGPSLLQTGQQ